MPFSVRTGAGVPVTVTVKRAPMSVVNVAAARLLIAGVVRGITQTAPPVLTLAAYTNVSVAGSTAIQPLPDTGIVPVTVVLAPLIRSVSWPAAE